MIKVNLQGKYERVNINTMIDSGATEDFIDKRICDKHEITTKVAERPREIYLADGNLSEMGPITHISKKEMCVRRIASASGRPVSARLAPYAWCV